MRNSPQTKRTNLRTRMTCVVSFVAAVATLTSHLPTYAGVSLTQIGDPVWEPTDFVMASFDIGQISREVPIRRRFVGDLLGSSYKVPDGLNTTALFPGESQDGPLDSVLRRTVAAQGGINTDVFLPEDVRNPVYMIKGSTIVPSENAPMGASRDSELGPVMPNDIFPITAATSVRFNGGGVGCLSCDTRSIVALDSIGSFVDTDGQTHDVSDLSWSHIVNFRTTAWNDPNRADSGMLGNYVWTERLRDANGNGWDIVREYDVRTPTDVLGDFNYNGALDLDDYNILKQNVDFAPAAQVSGALLRLDLNNDTLVNDNDTSHLAGMFPTPDAVELSVTSPYVQDFDSMGPDGAEGSSLPAAWTVTDEYGTSLRDETNVAFPTASREVRAVSQPKALNVGETDGDNVGDRSLAIHKPQHGKEAAVQLLAETAGRADALQLGFSVEAWDRIRATTENRKGGEAKFDVKVEIDSDDGTSDIAQILGGDFTELLSFGTVTTGPGLPKPDGDFLNGNDPAHRHVFSSDVLHADIPAGSRLRFRWETSDEADASGEWIFGIDDVSISLAAAGDTNLDGEINFDDFLMLSNNFGQAGDWRQGDFDGNGEVEFADFLALSSNFGEMANSSAASVPEPSSALLVLIGLLGLIGCRRP